MNTNEKCIENQLSYKQKRILKPLKSLQYRTSSGLQPDGRHNIVSKHSLLQPQQTASHKQVTLSIQATIIKTKKESSGHIKKIRMTLTEIGIRQKPQILLSSAVGSFYHFLTRQNVNLNTTVLSLACCSRIVCYRMVFTISSYIDQTARRITGHDNL